MKYFIFHTREIFANIVNNNRSSFSAFTVLEGLPLPLLHPPPHMSLSMLSAIVTLRVHWFRSTTTLSSQRYMERYFPIHFSFLNFLWNSIWPPDMPCPLDSFTRKECIDSRFLVNLLYFSIIPSEHSIV